MNFSPQAAWQAIGGWFAVATAVLSGLLGWASFLLIGDSFAPFLFWPPVGIALGASLMRGYRMAPAAAAGTFAAVFWASDIGLVGALSLAFAVALQAVLGCALLQRQDFHTELDRMSDLFKLIFHGGLLAAVPTLPLLHFALRHLDPVWGLGDVQFALFGIMGQLVSAIIVAALLLGLLSARCPCNGARWPEVVLAFTGLSVLVLAISRPDWFGIPLVVMRPYPILPFMLWLALRTNLLLTAGALLGVFAAMSSAIGWGRGDPLLQAEGLWVLPLHGFLLTVMLTFLSLAIAITLRNRIEKRLQQSEARHRGIIESSRSWFWAADADSGFSYVSPQVGAMLGINADTLLGRDVSEVFDADSARSFLSLSHASLADGQAALQREHVVRKPNGTTVYLETSCVPKCDENGRVNGCQCITRNISHLSETRRALLEANIRFQQLAENIHEVFWIARSDFSEILYVSPACTAMFGLGPEALYREPLAWVTRVHEADQSIADSGLAQLRKGEPVSVEFRIMHPEFGVRWLFAHVFPFADQDGEPLIAGILEDISDRKQAEDARLAYAISQRETLIREVHHRIKNNLQTVVSLLRREAGKMPEATVAIEAAIAQVQSVALVHGLQGQIARQSIMVCELLPAIVGMVSGLTGVAIHLTGVRAGCGHLHVRENETVAVALVLNELVTNAVKHHREYAMQTPRIYLEIVGKAAHIHIINTGNLPAGFDFSSGHGIGLGLGLVRSLMSAEGMRLSYRQIGEEVEALIVLDEPVLNANFEAAR